jgi:hypothetical protein
MCMPEDPVHRRRCGVALNYPARRGSKGLSLTISARNCMQVVSNRMQKTVVVAVNYVVWVPRYHVYEKRVGRHMVRGLGLTLA